MPVSDDPERRIAVIANQWKLVEASKLPLDEQRAWAVVAARQLTPADVHTLTERIVGLQPEARELFFFTCAAENKHRKLRLSSLGDLAAAGPSQTTFAMACRLVEAAPTWQQDRGQGARVLLLAMGDGKIEAPADRIVAWTWRLARAARDHEYRYAGSHIPDGRSLLGALAGAKSDSEHSEACLRLAAVAPRCPARGRRRAPRRRLAAARHRRRAAGRGRPGALSEDPIRLAAALGSNIPAPAQRAKAAKKTKRKARGARRDGLVQRRRGRLDAAGGAAAARRRRRRGRGRAAGRRAAARRRRPGHPRRLGVETLRWRLAGDERRPFETAVEVRAAAAEVAPLQVAVAKLLNESDRASGRPPIGSTAPGSSCRSRRDEAAGAGRRCRPPRAGAAQDGGRARPRAGRVRAARRRGRSDVRDSRPGAVRKIARGEPVGASPERRDRRRRSARPSRPPCGRSGASRRGAPGGRSGRSRTRCVVDVRDNRLRRAELFRR